MSREAVRAVVESARDIEPSRPLISRCAADITPEPNGFGPTASRIDPEDLATLLVSVMTLDSGRTTVRQGAVHLLILASCTLRSCFDAASVASATT